MAEDLVISLGLDDSKISPKIKKLQADFDVATAKIRKQQQAIQDMQKELAYWNNEMAKSGKGVSKTMMAEKIDPLNQKIEEANIKLKQMQAAAEVTGQKLDSAMGNGSDKASRMSKAVSKAGNAFKDFGKRLVSVAKSALIFTVLYSAFNKLRQMFSGYLKSNAKFADSLALIKGNLLTAFQAIYDSALPAINSLMDALVKASAYVSYFFNALAGKDITNAAQAAEDLYEQANATEQVTEATEKANKALASFDELNTVDVGKETVTGGSSSESNTKPDFGFDYSTINTEFIDNVVERIKDIVDSLKTAWNWIEKNLGGFNGILSIAGAIGTAILGWKIGTKVYNFFSNLGKNGANIGKALTGVAITISGVNFLYDGVKKATINGAYDSTSFWEMIGGELEILLGCTVVGMTLGSVIPGMGTATGALIGLVAGAVISIGTILKANSDAEKEQLDQAIKESGLGQQIEYMKDEMERQAQVVVDVHAQLELKKENIQNVEETHDYLQQLIDDIFDLSDMEDKTKGQKQLLKGLVEEFNTIIGDADALTLNVDSSQVVQSREEVERLEQAWYDSAMAQASQEYLVELYRSSIKLNNELETAKKQYADLMNEGYVYWKNAFSEDDLGNITPNKAYGLEAAQKISDELYNGKASIGQIGEAWKEMMQLFNDGLSQQATNIQTLQDEYNSISKELENFISSSSTAAASVDDLNLSISELSSPEIDDDIFSGIRDSAKDTKTQVDDLYDSINKILKSSWSNVPRDTIFSGGISISRMIPALARGAVLPANKPFLAIVGDQTSGTNVEAPLSTIKQAVREVLAEGGTGYGSEITIPIYIDGDKVDEAVVRRQDIRRKMSGLTLA